MIFEEYKKYHDFLKLIVDMISNYNKRSLSFKGTKITDIPIHDLNIILENFIKKIDSQKVGDLIGESKKKHQKYEIDLISKLLINGWYDECAYHDPFVEEPTKIIKPESEESFTRLKFPSWRIAQSYYSIYHTTAAVVRLKEYSSSTSHNQIMKSFVSHFSSELDNFYMYPFCCYLKKDKFINGSGLDYKENEYKSVLNELYNFNKRKGKADAETTNFLHIFRAFREWCNYNAGEVLILFRSKHLRDYLDINLRTLIYLINGMNELYLIKFLGYEKIADIFEDFYKNTVVNLKFDPKTITSRFAIYENNIKKVDKRYVLANKAKNRYIKEKDIEILNSLGKEYFSTQWIFHARKTFSDILRIDSSYKKATDNISRIAAYVNNLGNVSSITYKTEYFEDKSSRFAEVSREKMKKMKRERVEKAKNIPVRVGVEWGKFFVQSQSSPGQEYEVNFDKNIICHCRDFQFRKKTIKECKHIKAAKPIWSSMQLV